MRRISVGIVLVAFQFALIACGNVNGANLLFGHKRTVGVSMGTTASTQGAELTLGYEDREFAVVPVAVEQADGNLTSIESEIKAVGQKNAAPAEDTSRDALSVLGQFSTQATAGTQAGFGLGQFFATGVAAQKLADGFADQLGQAPANPVP